MSRPLSSTHLGGTLGELRGNPPILGVELPALPAHKCASPLFPIPPTLPIPAPPRLEVTGSGLEITLPAAGRLAPGHAIYAALDTDRFRGSAVLPFGQGNEGSTVFLPFRADTWCWAALGENGLRKCSRTHLETMWGEPCWEDPSFEVSVSALGWRLRLPRALLGPAQCVGVVIYEKDLTGNGGWGRMLASEPFGIREGIGDQSVSRFEWIDLGRPGPVASSPRARLRPEGTGRVRIYQLLPRLFGNVNETRQPNGTLAANGVGKFADINAAAIASLKDLGVTHVWLTGVLQQATSTGYPAIGKPADDPDLLKGLAGSPYAIKDYFDLCPDYALDPARRLEEFKALLGRLHDAGLQAIIDFVPNHVARSHQSGIRPELSFGAADDRSRFFSAQNNFFWLQADSPGGGPPLRLPTVEEGRLVSPTCQVLGRGDGLFDGERDCGRVTGNNAATWRPSMSDWYETVKLNYGFDFTTGQRDYPHGQERSRPIPDTWWKMDEVLAYWQEQGVDGFRCDMAHMVPPEFWAWAIARARVRQPEVFFAAEAYDNDPAKVPGGDPLLAALNERRGNVMFDLLSAGFNAVYDDPAYKRLKALYDGPGWANDLDQVAGSDFLFHHSLRYAENHDEVRLAGKGQWANIGMEVGRPVSAILFGLGQGPVLLYSGQEVGEPAGGAEGFGGDDARTTIFDYWSMPELVKWVNGHQYDGARLSESQRALRAFYGRLLHLVAEPAFCDGEFFALNAHNIGNERFGRLPGEGASGHWLHAFLRFDARSGQRFLVAANLHRSEPLHDVQVHLPGPALQFLRLEGGEPLQLRERLESAGTIPLPGGLQAGASIGTIPPLTAWYFELQFPGR